MSDPLPYVALVTCFDENEKVNLPAVRKQVRRQIAAGNNIMCCGTNGDFSSLTHTEKTALCAAVVDEVDGRVKVIANAGTPSTFETVLLAKEFAALGVDAIPVISPYFISCTQEGLITHFSTVADSVDVPVYVYDFPARTQHHVEPATMATLSAHPNIAGIKDSGGAQESLDAYLDIAKNRDDFDVYSGPDSLIYHGLVHGSSGCISGLANVMPEALSAICQSYASGDLEAARQHQRRFSELRTDLYQFGYPPAMTKRALYLIDRSVGGSRRPALVASADMDDRLTLVLKKHGLLPA